MSQIQRLKVFVSERLTAAASEILGAIEKTIADYEEKTSRLKEENDRHRSLLDMILKSKLTETAGHANKSSPTPAGPSASDSASPQNARKSLTSSSDLQNVFTSRTDFLKFAAKGNCPYCLRKVESTETHLTKRHYLFAVHYIDNGTEKFVVPCLCKDRIQGRSHWHCPYCRRIIYRKYNFEAHLLKQHGYTILQQSPDAEINQRSAKPEPWCQQELGSLDQDDQEDQQALLPLQVKEEQDVWTQVSQPELQCSEQLQIEGAGLSIISVHSFIQDISEIDIEQSCKERLPKSAALPLETQSDGGTGEMLQPAVESQHTTEVDAVAENKSSSKNEKWKKTHIPCSSLKELGSKWKKRVKKSLPLISLNVKKSTQFSASQDPTGPHCCKACGKIFHYMYTLRTHVQTHAMDKIHICGICGKRSASKESFIQHLQIHTKKNKCSICGKQFSNHSRLKQHRRFHRPKGLNVMLSA